MYSCLKNAYKEEAKAKDNLKCIIKRRLEFENYKNCFDSRDYDVNELIKENKKKLKKSKTIMRSQQRFKKDSHEI